MLPVHSSIYGWHQDRTGQDPIYLSYGNEFERVVALVIQNENEEKCLIPSLNLADFTFALSASSSLNLECRFCTFIELNKMGI